MLFPKGVYFGFRRLFEKCRGNIAPIALFSCEALRNELSVFSMVFPFGEVLQFRFSLWSCASNTNGMTFSMTIRLLNGVYWK